MKSWRGKSYKEIREMISNEIDQLVDHIDTIQIECTSFNDLLKKIKERDK